MSSPIHLIGAGGHAKVVLDALQKSQQPLGGIFDLVPQEEEIKGARALIAIGDNRLRQGISQQYRDVHWATVIHPSALIHRTVSLGRGTYVGAGVIIQPDVRVGAHCIINTGAILEHDCVIQDYVHIAPRVTLTGAVTIEEGCLIGAGTTVIPQQMIGAWSVIGAGSTVVHAIPPNSKAWGNPCQVREEVSVQR